MLPLSLCLRLRLSWVFSAGIVSVLLAGTGPGPAAEAAEWTAAVADHSERDAEWIALPVKRPVICDESCDCAPLLLFGWRIG